MSELMQLQRSSHITRPIDNTALDAFTQCDWKFLASMIWHRRREGALSPALCAGDALHKMLEVHYKTGGDREMVLLTLQAVWQGHDREDDFRTPERMVSIYDDYIRFWGAHDHDCRNNGKTVGYPEQPLVEIPLEVGWTAKEDVINGFSPASLHPYTGKLDRIIEWQGLYYVEDHKTTAAPGGDGDRFGGQFWSQFDPSNQMMGYAVLAQEMTGLPIAGVRINGIGWLKTKTKFGRQLISYAPQRLVEWKSNYNRLVERLEEGYRRLAAGDPPEIAFPRTWRCHQKYGACTYVDICTTIPQRRQQVLEQDFVVNEWNPMHAGGEEAVE